jgi:GGDEF domain-containing protein
MENGRTGAGQGANFGGRYDLRLAPELTAAIAARRWRELNHLLSSLVVLHGELRHHRSYTPVVRSCRAIVSASRGMLVVREGAEGEFRLRAEMGFPRTVRERLHSGRRMASAALVSRKPLLISNPPEGDLGAEIQALGGGSCLAVPILPGGVPWGTVLLFRAEPFDEEEAVLAWIYVLVLEEALADLAIPPRAAAADPALVDCDDFERRLDEEIERSAWSGSPLSLLLLEWPPPEEGGEDEDALLQRVVRVLRRTLRPLDLSCIGRDENLLVCLPGVNSGEAGSVAQSIRRNLVQSRLLGEETRVVSSLRISSATFPLDGRSRQELIDAVSGRRENGETAEKGSCVPRAGAPPQDAGEGSGSPPEGTGRSV